MGEFQGLFFWGLLLRTAGFFLPLLLAGKRLSPAASAG